MWYNTGTVTLTNGSTAVTGASTAWVSNGTLNAGDMLYAPDGKIYQIASIQSDTGLTLSTNYLGSSGSSLAYNIIPIGLLPSTLAQAVKSTLATVNNAYSLNVRTDINTQGLTTTQQQNARTNIAVPGFTNTAAVQSINFIDGFSTTATAAGSTTLTATSNYVQEFTGTTTQSVVLPAVSTLTLGQSFNIINKSTGAVTVLSSGSNTVQTLMAGAVCTVTCNALTGTTAAQWDTQYTAPTTAAGVSTLALGATVFSGAITGNQNASFGTIEATGNISQGAANTTNNLNLYSPSGGTWMATQDSVLRTAVQSSLFGNLGTGEAAIYQTGNYPIGFYVNATKVVGLSSTGLAVTGAISATGFTLDTNGNLGLGVTPSAWGNSNNYKVLQLGVGGALVGNAGDSRVWLSSNAYQNTSNVPTFIGTGYATTFNQPGNGTFVWGVSSASGTAGDPIYFTTAMTLDASGHLLVGYTSSNGSYAGQFNGQLFATSSTVATSDKNYKTNIAPITGALALVNAFKPVTFDWKKHPVHNFNTEITSLGFLAQDMQEALANTPFLDSVVKESLCTLTPAEYETIVVTPAVAGVTEQTLITPAVAEVTEQVLITPAVAQVLAEDGVTIVTPAVAAVYKTEIITPAVGAVYKTTVITPAVAEVTEQKLITEAVTESFLGIAEGNLISILTAAIQELSADFNAYKAAHP